ncbi:MAG TPA: tetratricopeptide repeat protein [Acidobacteriaceae bacterium]|nr:tetratricopeptide repeat protein [Acidobacteriaceae bacterium]
MRAGLEEANRGDLVAARRDLERVVRLAPQIAPGHSALGSVLLSLNQPSEAELELRTALRLAPGDVPTQISLARCDSALGRHAEAVILFREATSKSQDVVLSEAEVLAFAVSLSATGDNAAAMQLLTSAEPSFQNSAPIADAIGVLLAGQGQSSAALHYFDRALELDPNSNRALYHRAAALLETGQALESVTSAQELEARTNPPSFDVELLLGRALSATHDDSHALTHLRRAVGMHPELHSSGAQYALALALQASGDSAGALPWFARVVNDGSALPAEGNSPLINYALARVQTGDATGALLLYARALEEGRDSATLREDYGAAYLQANKVDEALKQFTAGIRLEPNSALLHYDLGLAFKLQDNLTEAVPEFEKAAALDQSLPDPPYTLAIIYMQQGRFADAASSLRDVLRLQPENGEAWALLGSVLKDSEHMDEAAEALQHAIALEPDQPSLHIQLAAIETTKGNKERAAAERKIAADLSRAANEHQRANFALRSGRALLAQGQLDMAVLQLKTAANAEPALAEPHLLLAEAYTKQGKTAAAALERKEAAKRTNSVTP